MKRHTSSLSEKSFFYFVPFFLAILLSACGGGGSDNGGVPKGAGSPEIIGSSGGTRTSDDGKASIEIPAGALSQDTTISVTVASNLAAGNIGTAYHFEPDGTTFSQPVTISISYDEATLSQLIIEKNLRLGKLVNGRWQLVAGSTVEIGSNKVSGKTTSFSIYGVIFVSNEVTAPVLISPIEDKAIAQNDSASGCRVNPSTGSGFKILFDWEDSTSPVGIARYQFSLKQKGSLLPIVDTIAHTSEFTYQICNNFIADSDLNDWEWSVKTEDNDGNFSALSTGLFHFEPCRLDGSAPCTEGSGLFAPTVTAVAGDGQVTLSWPNVEGATSYNLYRALDSGVTKENLNFLNGWIKQTGVTSPLSQTALTNGRSYYFVVTAVSTNGESPESLEVIATPFKVSQPVNLTGRWSGFASGQLGGIILDLTQVGSNVSGTFSCLLGSAPCLHDGESISGSVNGSVLTATVGLSGNQPCELIVNVSSGTMSGTHKCSNPINPNDILFVSKQIGG